MHTDLPLTKSDQDKLGRYLFASEIANGLVNSFQDNNESIVIGINGPWGTGKSTLVNFIINEIEQQSNKAGQEIIVLKFNPWMFTGQKELQNIFLKELYLKFTANTSKLKQASKKLAEFLTHLNWLKYVHTGTGEVVKEAKEFLEGVTKEKDLSELKEDVDDLLIESKTKLYITIDDIDRLTPTEITDIFQLVKLNGNFANTIFILAYDNEIVKNALEKQFGGNGKKYIEKIVQIDYSLPNVSKENIIRIFLESLDQLFITHEVKQIVESNKEKLKSGPIIKLFSSIRDIYRFNNSIKLRISSIYKDLNIVDLFLLESLRIFRPEAYNFIYSSKYKLTSNDIEGNISSNNQGKLETKEEYVDKSAFDSETKLVIKVLFDIGKSYFTDFTTADDLIRDKRIANPSYFDRYFNLQLSESDIEESIFNTFLNDSDLVIKVNTLTNIYNQGKLFQFLNWVEIKSKFTETEVIESITLAAFKFSQEFNFKNRSFISSNSVFLEIIRFCSRMLEKLNDIDSRRKVIEKHTATSEDLVSFSSLYTCQSILRSKALLDKNKLFSNYMWYSLFSNETEDDDNFEKIILQRYKRNLKWLLNKELDSPNFLSGEELIFILPDLARYHSKYYNKKLSEYIQHDANLLYILRLCITRSYIASGSVIGYQLAKHQLLPGMDVEMIKERFEGINQEKLDQDQVATINFFLQAYRDGFQEKKFYDFHTLLPFNDGYY